MTGKPATYRFSIANHPAECSRVFGVVADGTIRCRIPAAVTVEYLGSGRESHFCPGCYAVFWTEPSLEEIEAVQELRI